MPAYYAESVGSAALARSRPSPSGVSGSKRASMSVKAYIAALAASRRRWYLAIAVAQLAADGIGVVATIHGRDRRQHGEVAELLREVADARRAERLDRVQ